MRNVFPLVILITVLAASSTIGAPLSIYEIVADLCVVDHRLTGQQRLTVTNTFGEELSSLFMLLLPNFSREKNPYLGPRAIDATFVRGFDPSYMEIDSVIHLDDGLLSPLRFDLLAAPPGMQTFSLKETILAIRLNRPLAVGETISIQISFRTRFPHIKSGDMGHFQRIFTWRFGWHPILTSFQGTEAEAMVAGKIPWRFELPAAHHHLTLTLPREMVLISGADFIERLTTNKKFHRYRLWNDRPARSIAIVAGPDYRRFALDGLPIPIEVFYLPGHEETARLFATYAVDALQFFVERFGRYSRRRITIVQSPNPLGISMAADGIFFMANFFFTHRHVTLPGVLNRLAEFVLAHEIAHQWWGIGIGVDFNAQNWLSEGLVQYMSISYFEYRHGEFGPNLFELERAGLLEGIFRSQFGFFNLREHMHELPYIIARARGFDEAIINPQSEVRYANETMMRIYQKGYLVARALSAKVGSEEFVTALRDAHYRFSDRIITLCDLQNLLEEQTGIDLDQFVYTWLLTAGSVDYSLEIIKREKIDKIYYTTVVVRRDGGTPQRVVIQAITTREIIRIDWDGVAEEETLILKTDAPVRRVTIDPDHLLPDRHRLNNHSPTRVVLVTTYNQLPLDAYLIRTEPLAGIVMISYLDRLTVTIGRDFAGIHIRYGRHHDFLGHLSIAGGELTGSVAYSFTGFSQPATGSAATLWVPSYFVTISGHRRLTAAGLLHYLSLQYTRIEMVRRQTTTTVALDLIPHYGGRISISTYDEAFLAPNIYLLGNLSVGVRIGELPSVMQFGLPEMHTFGTVVNGYWLLLPIRGNYRLFGRLALKIPAPVEDHFNVANIAMIDSATNQIFIAAGAVGQSLNQLVAIVPQVEVGVEVSFNLSLLGGLMRMRFTIGYAYPLLGQGFPGGRIFLHLS
ncbi:hypothetical protein LM597_02750 [Candidatus Acetothermia bacterium]|nr:hypothetical protein [Candidatus Acetothermia bacterium]